jgi:hypothetical protein
VFERRRRPVLAKGSHEPAPLGRHLDDYDLPGICLARVLHELDVGVPVVVVRGPTVAGLRATGLDLLHPADNFGALILGPAVMVVAWREDGRETWMNLGYVGGVNPILKGFVRLTTP